MSFRNSTCAIIIIVAVFLQVFNPAKACAQLTRSMQNLNADWAYLENNTDNPTEALQLQGWSSLQLPHTWNQWDAVDAVPGYRRDASWYKKDILIKHENDVLHKLYFEGSNITTKVYVNGRLAGEHIGGYVGFEIDITPFIKTDNQPNQILIRVDNSVNPEIIPSQKADFFIYGGITRDLWLKTVPKIHLENLQINTPIVSKQAADTEIKISANQLNGYTKCQIVCQIIDPISKQVVSENQVNFTSGKEVIIKMPSIKNPRLWSPASPSLYSCQVSILRDGKQIDQLSSAFGYRWFEFKDYGAFYLNGERLLLRGTHRHEEYAGYGAAMPNELHWQDMQMIKDIGANFVRLGHYPQDPEIYKACDELGLIVWDELPWCRGGIGNKSWKTTTKNLLKEQITQNYNHPSIIIWSLGNEIYWLPDFKNGDDTLAMNAYLRELHEMSHQMDPDRLTAIRKYYAGSDIVDVFSPSIWSGWYAGIYDNYKSTLIENQQKYPKFLHMEYGGSSHVGRHTENPITGAGSLDDSGWEEVVNQVNMDNIAKNGDWTENYMVDLFDWYLHTTEQLPNFTGNAQWAFKEFGTPLRPENAIPYMNQKGLVDRAGKPKDAYYVFQSYWSPEPMVYIESHTWTERNGPEGLARSISVYSNVEEVELFHKGISLGIKKRDLSMFPACGLNWDLIFAEGPNELIAFAKNNGKIVSSDTLTVQYNYDKPGSPDHIALSAKKLINGNYLIEALMLDKDNRRVIDYEKRVYFDHNGNGKLLVNYGTADRSQIIEMSNGRAVIELVPGKGSAIIEARNQDFKGSYLTIDFDEITNDKILLNATHE